MMKKSAALLSIFFSFFFFTSTSYAFFLEMFVSPIHANCSQALPTDNPAFCASFKSVAECHCTSSGLPPGMCQDMTTIYNRMVKIFGSQQKACEYQKDVPTQQCMDDWNCYRSGGRDSQGKLCSSTGQVC
jgi:hypothetical protein